jgi:hypothetical protein
MAASGIFFKSLTTASGFASVLKVEAHELAVSSLSNATGSCFNK